MEIGSAVNVLTESGKNFKIAKNCPEPLQIMFKVGKDPKKDFQNFSSGLTNTLTAENENFRSERVDLPIYLLEAISSERLTFSCIFMQFSDSTQNFL